jgi:1,4-alpha-glucan branching enzyme
MQKFANLRAMFGYMWAHPGKKLLFMGGEFGQWREWNETESLDWHLLESPNHKGVLTLIHDLNQLYHEHPELWESDSDASGFSWIEVDNAAENIIAFRRIAPSDGKEIIFVGNFSPVVREGHRIGLPRKGTYKQILNTDAEKYCGGGFGVVKSIKRKRSVERASIIRRASLCRRWGRCGLKGIDRLATSPVRARVGRSISNPYA